MKKNVVSVLLLLLATTVNAAVKLPKIFTDNMVVQRDKQIKIWGWADRGETITVSFNNQSAKAKTNSQGQWMVILPAMKFGGPYEMKINNVVLHNVLIGDVWFCSGQSNMEMPVQGWTKDSTLNATKEIRSANYPNIRLFTVPKAMSYVPATDFEGGSWQVCSPASVASFSAVAYYFGRKLNQDLDIPIGLINSTWGGTNIEAWSSWDEMGKLPQYKDVNVEEFTKNQKEQTQNREKYAAALANDPGVREQWQSEQYNASTWKKIAMPKVFEESEIGNADGIIWFRKEFELGEAPTQQVSLSLGAIDDADETYINGHLVGKTNSWNEKRNYSVKPDVLKKGKNILVIKMVDTGGYGGFSGNASELFLQTADHKISLAGEWQYKEAVTSTQFHVQQTGPNAFPSQLYNAMVAPVINFPIEGVIWYQGEANTSNASAYKKYFPAMINDWRKKWNDQFPFFWTQLANFMSPVAEPAESDWASLREAQHKTLAVANTGEAVIIDIGEANDIHPRNKQDVGKRLALVAEKVAYKKDVVFSGPVFKNADLAGNKIILSFDQLGSGLIAKGDRYGYLKGFAIAGADNHFVWAKAYIDGDKVVVYNDTITDPKNVRYAWGDNPDDVNLFNKEGLPASPFRTDHQ